MAFSRAVRSRCIWAVAVAAIAAVGGRPAAAFEFFDGRIQIHGYVEEQWRAIAADYDYQDGWDLSQWYNILAVETDLNLFPDGIGPFDLVSGFVRLEARYDCIWSHGCGMFHGVNAWGDAAKKFPERNSSARKSGYTGSLFTDDTRRIHGIPVDELGFADKDTPHRGENVPAYLWHVPGVDTLFGVKDPQQTPQLDDDPAFYVFRRYVRPSHEYRFALRSTKGQPDGRSLQVLGPFLPENKIAPVGALRDIANPFSSQDRNPVLVAAEAGADGVVGSADDVLPVGSAALPYRPAPAFQKGNRAPGGDEAAARGLFLPNERVAKLIRDGELDDFDQNFSESELAWNKGASQQQTRELKEAYVDLEALDSRLWIRAGKQNIVWGKTELFRTTDQFNPQDLALATLASLEETRIALWSVRGVYSFYSIGPLEDVRLELAVNLDPMEPTDLGRCGEPYTPNPVCDKTAGLFAHGLAGFALVGEARPPDFWEDVSGLEYGARLEFRWDRFSFAISDFYGYDDFPYVDPVFYYSRNVDPRTGRPRRAQTTADCDPDGLHGGSTEGCLDPEDALEHHHANQQRFAVICASSVGFNDLDRSACAQSVFNSNRNALTTIPDVSPTIAETLGIVMSGSGQGRALVLANFIQGAQTFPTIRLNNDWNDGAASGPFGALSLSAHLTDEQEGLLGCGRFWGTSCDTSYSDSYAGPFQPGFGGIDLLNAELSALIQSFPGFPGTSGAWRADAGPGGPIQPGTIRFCTDPNAFGCKGKTGFVPFQGGAVARRFERGRAWTLPGARSPFVEARELRMGKDGWSAGVDGCVRAVDPNCAGARDLRHPYSGDYFQSEMAAFSWNYMLLLVALSGLGAADSTAAACPPGTRAKDRQDCFLLDEFVPTDELRLDGCSYARPELCSNVQAIYSVAHTTRKDVRAGGSGDFGRTDFDWHQAGVGVLRYEKRNVLGFSTDFAEDVTKSNWGIESTWIEGNQFEDNDELDRLRRADTFNVTVSVDRPTFINFLNQGRTFFFNTQWFFQYISGYRDSFTAPGPWNVLATFHVDTGYFRDRLLPGITLVWDFQSNSGAILPEIAYRFTENLSATITLALFNGRWQPYDPPIRSINDFPYRAGHRQSVDWTEQGLSPIRDNDEVALRIRYTF
jgi:hypothetical protein